MRTDLRLCVGDHQTGLRVRNAQGLLSRALGAWPRLPRAAFEALLLPACRAVHTFGMAAPIDVVFTDESGRVTAVRPALPPWRVAACRAACATWEFEPGSIERLRIAPGSRLRARRVRGATLVEFLLAAMLVVMPMVFVTLELARLAVTRHALQHAVNDAAREAGYGEPSGMTLRRSVAYGLLPLHVPTDPRDALAEPGGRGSAAERDPSRGWAALSTAYAETFRPDLTRLTIESADGAVIEPGFDTLPWPDSGGAWRLRVRYCRELVFPLAKDLIPGVARWGATSIFDQACHARERMPVEVTAIVLRPPRDMRASPGALPDPPPGDDREPPVPPPLPEPEPGPDPRPSPNPVTPEIER